jgi:hypothetical protein
MELRDGEDESDIFNSTGKFGGKLLATRHEVDRPLACDVIRDIYEVDSKMLQRRKEDKISIKISDEKNQCSVNLRERKVTYASPL